MNWAHTLPILTQFGGGAVLCLVGIIAGLKSGYLNLQVRDDRRSIYVIIAGYLALLLYNCIFTYWLPYV